MPIYEYSCSNCGKVVDVLQKRDDPAPAECENCHSEGKMVRMVSRTSFVLKGGGWYSDLYGSSKKDSDPSNAASGSATVPAAASSTGGSDSSKAAPAAASAPVAAAPAAAAASSSPAPKADKK